MKMLYRNFVYEAIDLDNPIKGGVGDHANVDPELLEKGVEVEKEHVGDLTDPSKLAIAADIARDHLKESPKYYDELEKMEKKLGID